MKDIFHLSDQSRIISKSAERERDTAAICLAEGWGYCTTKCEVIYKREERVLQIIRQVINIDEQKAKAQNTALEPPASTRRGEEKGPLIATQ